MNKKTFRIVAVSSNANSFGLRNVIFLSRDGEGWEAAANAHNIETLNLVAGNNYVTGCNPETGVPHFSLEGFELVHNLSPAPLPVLQELFPAVPASPVAQSDLEDFAERLGWFVAEYFRAEYPNSIVPDINIELGRKYARIVREEAVERTVGETVRREVVSKSVYCFVELATGNILKPAGWSAPAKGVRGNIRDAGLFGQGRVCGVHSVVYHNR